MGNLENLKTRAESSLGGCPMFFAKVTKAVGNLTDSVWIRDLLSGTRSHSPDRGEECPLIVVGSVNSQI